MTAATGFGGLVGRAPAMLRLFLAAEQLTQNDAPLLITGEAGTGKHVLARTIHAGGPRRTGPFIALDCGEIAPAALESELFGRPAGERSARAGALELARGGGLLLDEVSELSLPLQLRLEAALERGAIAEGAGVPPLDVRVIAATKRKLTLEVDRQKFRPALAARFTQGELSLPPLRERREDIPLLAQHLLAQRDPHAGAPIPRLSQAALTLLALHDWPGNVRELRNVLERCWQATERGSLEVRQIAALLLGSEPPGVERGAVAHEGEPFEPGLSYREQRARFENGFEQRYVAWLLELHDGNVSAAARAAEMDRKYLYKLARKHALKPPT